MQSNSKLTHESMRRRLRFVGLNPDKVTQDDYEKVQRKLHWKESTFKAFLGYEKKPNGKLGQGWRDYIPTNQEVQAIKMELPYGFGVVLAYLGCRFSEMWELRYDASKIYSENSLADHLLIPSKKNSEPVSINLETIPGEVAYAIKEWMQSKESVSPQKIRRAWASLRASGRITRKCVPHSLRHRLIDKLIESGEPLAKVAKTVGHKSVSTTLRYAHQTPARQAEARNMVYLD